MKFKVGDLAITQNSIAPEWNNGLLVLVVTASPGFQTPVGLADYQIRRVDGRPFGWTTGFDGKQNFFSRDLCWCKELNLKSPEEAGLKEESVVQRHPMQGAADAMEAAIRQMGEEMVAQGLARQAPSRNSSVDDQSTASTVIPYE